MFRAIGVGLLVTLVMVAGIAFAQDARSGAVRPHAVSAPVRAVHIAGRVSRDAKLLISEDQESWVIGNPGAVRGQEGRWVTVKCQLSPDQSKIHVLSVTSSEASQVTRPSDAAFRR